LSNLRGGGHHRPLPRASGRLQGAAVCGVHERAQDEHGEDPEVRAAGARERGV